MAAAADQIIGKHTQMLGAYTRYGIDQLQVRRQAQRGELAERYQQGRQQLDSISQRMQEQETRDALRYQDTIRENAREIETMRQSGHEAHILRSQTTATMLRTERQRTGELVIKTREELSDRSIVADDGASRARIEQGEFDSRARIARQANEAAETRAGVENRFAQRSQVLNSQAPPEVQLRPEFQASFEQAVIAARESAPGARALYQSDFEFAKRKAAEVADRK